MFPNLPMSQTMPIVVSALLCLVSIGNASAQETTPYEARFAVRVGFAIGNDFSVGNTTRHIEGFQLGGDIPLIKRIPKVGGLTFSPTVIFAGSNRSGNDTDGLVYRLMLVLRRELGNKGLYGGIGFGYSGTDSHQNQFADTAGFASEFLLGYLFPKGESGRIQPLVEIGYHAGGGGKLSGWSLEAGIRF